MCAMSLFLSGLLTSVHSSIVLVVDGQYGKDDSPVRIAFVEQLRKALPNASAGTGGARERISGDQVLPSAISVMA